MAEHHQVLLPPQVEVAEPQLLVDELHQLADRGALARRRLEVERTGDMQQFDARDPGESDVVVGPFPGDEDRDLVLLGAVEGPGVDRGQPLDHVDGVLGSVVGDSLDRGHQGSFGAGLPGRDTTHADANPRRF